MGEKANDFHTLDISSDLHLSNNHLPNSEVDITVPEEINEYLRSQLQHVKHQNETLQQQLTKKDSALQKRQTKIQELTAKLQDYEGYCGGDYMSASQVANSKIVELSKKLREKNSEIEVFKAKCSKLENNLEKQRENTEKIEKREIPVAPNKQDEVAKLQEKLNHITNKWTEEKNHNLQLKNDLKKANKWLQQEIGDKFDTLLALNGANSNWRGRAQIICDLQQKNQELKEKLKAYEDRRAPSNESITTIKHDSKFDLLSKENLQIKGSNEELKKKLDMTKARCKALESECVSMKSKISSLNKKIDNDQETITRLTNQMSVSQHKFEDMKEKEELIKKLQMENESLKIELIREKCISENKSKELMEKNDDIQLLNKRIRSSRPPSSYVHKHEHAETKTIGRLEVERLRLLELTQIQNGRLEEERNAHLKTQHLLRAEKQKAAKLEANVARLQLEQNSTRSAYSSKVTTPKPSEYDDIKDKLELAEENIKALTTRLELEILERKSDLHEFSKILNNSG